MTPKEMLASDAPKCANCKHMAVVGKRAPRRTRWYEPKTITGFRADHDAPFEPVAGKGACMEPSLTKHSEASYPRDLFRVTDLMLCSLWERKEG